MSGRSASDGRMLCDFSFASGVSRLILLLIFSKGRFVKVDRCTLVLVAGLDAPELVGVVNDAARFAAGVWKKLDTADFCDAGGFCVEGGMVAVLGGGEPVSRNDSHAESMWLLMSLLLTAFSQMGQLTIVGNAASSTGQPPRRAPRISRGFSVVRMPSGNYVAPQGPLSIYSRMVSSSTVRGAIAAKHSQRVADAGGRDGVCTVRDA